MRRRWKILIAIILLFVSSSVILSTACNEAHSIRRVFPEARVDPAHRFSPVFSGWDLASLVVVGDYVSPIDSASVVIRGSSEPVNLAKLLKFRVSVIYIYDSEIADFETLLNGHQPNVPIMLVNPSFPEATDEDLNLLEAAKAHHDGEELYWFGSA